MKQLFSGKSHQNQVIHLKGSDCYVLIRAVAVDWLAEKSGEWVNLAIEIVH